MADLERRISATSGLSGAAHPTSSPGSVQAIITSEVAGEVTEPRPEVEEDRAGRVPSLGVLADLNNATVYDYENYNLMRMLNSALVLENENFDSKSETRPRRPLTLWTSPSNTQNPLHGLPNELLSFYLERYFEHVDPIFPILDSKTINASLESLNGQQPISDGVEASTLYLALAIGAIFPSTDSILDANAACQLWKAASKIQITQDESENTLRVLILLALFSLLEEGCGNTWHLVELAVRSCIKLGLHSKSPEQVSSPELVNLFWTAYLLDRWVSCTLGLPVVIQNEEVDQEMPDIPPQSQHMPSATLLWHIAYSLFERDDDGASDGQLEQGRLSFTLSPLGPGHPSHLLYSMIAVDLQVAKVARCIVREDKDACQRFDKMASDCLSAIEVAGKRGFTLPWTNGYTAFVAVMVRLHAFGQAPRYRTLFAPSIPDSGYVVRAIDLLYSLGRRFNSLEPLGKILQQLQQTCTDVISVSRSLLPHLVKCSLNISQGQDTPTIDVPRHSEIFTITASALQSIGIYEG